MDVIHSENILTPAVDLTNCDREPIHIPNFIQPHGVLLALQESDLTILQVSCNSVDCFGLPPKALLNQPLSKLLDADQIALLRDCLSQRDLSLINPNAVTVRQGDRLVTFDGILHRSGEVLILELELPLAQKTHSFFNFYPVVKLALTRMQGASNLQELCDLIVEEVRVLTGFDRVMIYRFDEHWNGTVIAEDKQAHLDPYLGLKYPASDIPRQARQLYAQNWLRIISDVNYAPVPLVPPLNPLTNAPLDLSDCVLRSVSPLHIEYLHNMGVSASMSISLLKNKQLWGLIACHHESSQYVPYEIRNACEFLGQVTSLELAAKEESEDYEYRMTLKTVQSKLVEYMSREKKFVDGLMRYEPNLLDLVSATGAAICFDGEYFAIGETPAQEELESIVNWLSKTLHDDIFYTNSLSGVYQGAEKLKDVASGLIALSISKVPRNCVLWFRPEVEQTIDWAGNPEKPVELANDGSLKLSPRKSFELWKETVRLKCLPWKGCEIEAAKEFRSALVGIVLRKVDELAQLNIELERSNSELDAFAYIASHDLKEPLRGIHNYSSLLIEDYGKSLDEEAINRLQTLIRLTKRMDDLIDSLLHFSRLGRVDLSMQPTNLDDVVHRIMEMLSARIEESQVSISIPQPLPTVYCDRIKVGEVFSNLLVNAIKYNDKPEKQIEIGYTPEASETDPNVQSMIFYVKDNGIGIREKHFEAIFRIFKRLHAPNKYGGGTGAGLTIAKKIVERHGGKIWVSSTPGIGSTFYFTLHG